MIQYLGVGARLLMILPPVYCYQNVIVVPNTTMVRNQSQCHHTGFLVSFNCTPWTSLHFIDFSISSSTTPIHTTLSPLTTNNPRSICSVSSSSSNILSLAEVNIRFVVLSYPSRVPCLVSTFHVLHNIDNHNTHYK